MNEMVTHNTNNSLATLCNIGNSCYMNSVLYTLRFAPNFTHNLHHLVEFLELVLQKTSGDKQYALQQKQGQNSSHLNQHKPKSSSLGRNIPGVHGSSGRSWSSKDLASLGNVNGSDLPGAGGAFVGTGTSTGGVSGISSFGPYNGSVGSESGSAGNATANGINSAGANGSGGTGAFRNLRDGETGGNGGLKSNRHLVCETLHELFHSLARNEAADVIESFHAGSLLHAVQCVSATFEGNQQQDAHEFLMCILDSVRESCQTLNKNLLENPDLLRNSSCSTIGQAAPTDIVDASSAAQTATAATESKSSSAQFLPRSIFRRRKESLKNAKSALAKEGRSITVDSAVATVQPITGSAPLDTSLSEVANIINTTAVQKSSATDERLLQDRIRALGLNFFCEDFEGVTVSRTRCLTCETVTEQKETMIDIAIPITSNEGNDAAKNPQQFYQDACITQEYFRGDNKYRCEVCSGYTEACRTISFDILPRLLVLQLKRFNGDMEKINSYIPTPFVLQCFCRDCLGKPETEKRHVYRLYSVITHVGARMSVGHYIAYTSSLDTPRQYVNCVKDLQKRVLLTASTLDVQQSAAGTDGVSNGGTCGKGPNGNEKSASGQLKKLFGGKKASSAGDISKKLKNNVINRFSPALSNGIEALHLNGSNLGAAAAGSGSTGPPAHSLAMGSNEQLVTSANSGGGGGGGGGSGSTTTNGFCPPGVVALGANTSINGSAGGENLGTGAAKSTHSQDCLCQSMACCPVMAKHNAAQNQQQPLHVSSTSSSSSTSSGGGGNGSCMDARLGGSFHSTASSAAGSTNVPNVNCNNYLNFHGGIVSEMNVTGAAAPLLNCQTACGVPAANRNIANDLSQQQQLMWYMCDDDKIKIMTQHEFEEMLSPNRRHVITPYLLFYARYDVQQQKLQQSQPELSSKIPTASNISARPSIFSSGRQRQPV